MPPKIVNLSGFSGPEAETPGGIKGARGGTSQGGGERRVIG